MAGTINSSEITAIIKSKIENYSEKLQVDNVGSVIEISDGISRIYGLNNVMASELVEFDDGKGTLGITLNLEEDNVGVVILGDYTKIKEGMSVKSTGKIASVPVGDALIGRIIDPTGIPIDGKGEIHTDKTRPIERIAPGIIERKSVHEPLQTGLTAIDALTPIGRGQRELIIGDRQTGKTAIAIDTIINQKGKDVICIYVAIGQKTSTVAHLAKTLEEKGAMDYSIIVSATADNSAPLQYIAPFAGCAVAEEFLEPEGGSLIEYKFMCFNGKVEYIFVITGKNEKKGTHITVYSRDWKRENFHRDDYPAEDIDFKKPEQLSEMIKIAEKISREIKFLRVDMYNIKGRIYIGELTLYPTAGFSRFEPKEYNMILGNKIELDNRS